MVGNAAALINGFNPYDGDVDKMKDSIISFMSELGMNGIYEFDMKLTRLLMYVLEDIEETLKIAKAKWIDD